MSEAVQALGELLTAPHFQEVHLGHLAGFWRLSALEGGHLLAGQLQFSLARGLEPAIVHAAVVQTATLPVLSLAFPVATDPEPLGRAPVKETQCGWKAVHTLPGRGVREGSWYTCMSRGFGG